jgi:hypothetical protein
VIGSLVARLLCLSPPETEMRSSGHPGGLVEGEEERRDAVTAAQIDTRG